MNPKTTNNSTAGSRKIKYLVIITGTDKYDFIKGIATPIDNQVITTIKINSNLLVTIEL